MLGEWVKQSKWVTRAAFQEWRMATTAVMSGCHALNKTGSCYLQPINYYYTGINHVAKFFNFLSEAGNIDFQGRGTEISQLLNVGKHYAR